MRHRKLLAPINTVKHYVHSSNAVIATGAIRNVTLIDAVVAPATSNAFDVKEGAIIKAVYIEWWIKGKDAAGGSSQFTMIIEKNPVNVGTATIANMSNLGAYNNKKNVLYSTQGVIGDLSTNGVPILRTWVLIPKGKQRFGLADRLTSTILAIGTNGIQSCGIATYKEFI